MPSYDFECKDCHYVFTISRSMSDESIPSCPLCNSKENINRVWGCVNFGGMTNNSSSTSCSSCTGGSCSTCH